ncbi:hypothetical protein ACLOJK_032832 [Asimina triloba]
MLPPQHHPITPTNLAVVVPAKRGKKRGSYNCGRCGLPKKGHSCNIAVDPTAAVTTPPPARQQLRRSLSFDDDDAAVSAAPAALLSDEDEDDTSSSAGCLAEVLRRLAPSALLSAAQVCREWRDCARRVWRAAQELRLHVPPRAKVGFVGSVLRRCTGLVRLSLRVESDLDATMLACVAFSCPNLETLEISTADSAVNRITGDELGRFVAEKRCLSSLKIEGCSNLGFLSLCSSTLSTLWLSDLHSMSKMAINCPNLKELSLDFSRQENDSTDLISMVDNFGRSCPKLRNIHIASVRLSHAVVLALTSTNLRSDNSCDSVCSAKSCCSCFDDNFLMPLLGLRMLSLVLGSEITDASVAAITSSYANLELLDLSGSSISDGGIGMICNVLTDSLSRLLLALCPNVTSSNQIVSSAFSIYLFCMKFNAATHFDTMFNFVPLLPTSGGIQFATAQLPHLQLIDCGMTLCDPSVQSESIGGSGLKDGNAGHEQSNQQKVTTTKLHSMYQKLIIKHARLKKLSLWGCSGLIGILLLYVVFPKLSVSEVVDYALQALYLNCPELNDLNLNSCKNLHPERLLLQCPSLESVHASGCSDKLIGAIQSQVLNDFATEENNFPSKRLADGSKRVQVPRFVAQQLPDDGKGRAWQPRCTSSNAKGGLRNVVAAIDAC